MNEMNTIQKSVKEHEEKQRQSVRRSKGRGIHVGSKGRGQCRAKSRSRSRQRSRRGRSRSSRGGSRSRSRPMRGRSDASEPDSEPRHNEPGQSSNEPGQSSRAHSRAWTGTVSGRGATPLMNSASKGKGKDKNKNKGSGQQRGKGPGQAPAQMQQEPPGTFVWFRIHYDCLAAGGLRHALCDYMMSRKETEANEVKFWEGVLTVPQQTTGYVCWSNLGFYEVLWVLALWFLWVVALWFLWVLALWLLAFCLSLFTPLSGHSSQSLVTVLRENLLSRLDASFARSLTEKCMSVHVPCWWVFGVLCCLCFSWFFILESCLTSSTCCGKRNFLMFSRVLFLRVFSWEHYVSRFCV